MQVIRVHGDHPVTHKSASQGDHATMTAARSVEGFQGQQLAKGNDRQMVKGLASLNIQGNYLRRLKLEILLRRAIGRTCWSAEPLPVGQPDLPELTYGRELNFGLRAAWLFRHPSTGP